MQINDFEYCFYLGSSFDFDSSWGLLDSQRLSLYDPYHDFEIPKGSYSVFINKKMDLVFAFNDLKNPKIGSRPYDYQLFVDEEKFIINNVRYSLIKDLINHPKTSDNGIFVFTKSEKISYEKVEGSPVRCDYGIHGPVAFSGKLGASSYSFDLQDSAPVTLSHTYTTNAIMSCFDVGHIVYMEVTDPNIEIEAINNREVPCITRTLGEQLRLMIEWKALKEKPFNSKQDIVVIADDFLNQFKIPKELEKDIWKNQVDMQIVKYLKGDPKARLRPNANQVKEMTTLQKKWVASKFIFKGFENMKTVFKQEL